MAQPAPHAPLPRWDIGSGEARRTRAGRTVGRRCPGSLPGRCCRRPRTRPAPPSHCCPALANRPQALRARPAPSARSGQWRLRELGGFSLYPAPRPVRYHTAGVERSTLGEGSSTLGEGSSNRLRADPCGSSDNPLLCGAYEESQFRRKCPMY